VFLIPAEIYTFHGDINRSKVWEILDRIPLIYI